MRPIKLVMTAFGPYAGREEIDFRKLGDKNIFLITGPTGAGKTTIFDGISYAVYGEASGDGRDGESLRSQFAKDDLITSVEIYFELRGRKYYIKRIPKQMKPKSRGSGFTEQKTDAEMRMYRGDEDYDVISGVSSVNEKIENIMGINYQQFRQIMMIPQGEFRKLLVSDSREKEKILRKIFNTEIYSRFESRLSDMAAAIYNDIKLLNQKVFENINKIQYEEDSRLHAAINSENKNYTAILELLKEKINFDTAEDAELKNRISKFTFKMENIQKKIYESTENNKKLNEKVQLENVLKSLRDRNKDIVLKEKRLSMGKVALKIRMFEENYVSRKEDLEVRQKELEKNKFSIKDAENRLKEDESIFKHEESMEDYRNGLSEKLAELKSYRDKAKKLQEEKEILNTARYKFQKVKSEWENKKIFMEELKKEIDSLREVVDNSVDFKEKKLVLESKYDKLSRLYAIIQDLDKENISIVKIRKDYKLYYSEMNKNRALVDKEKEKLDHMEDLFRKNQAAFIAASLKEGEPCPVCGSLHHPSIARGKGRCVDDAEIEIQKKCMEKAENIYEKTRIKFQNVDAEGQGKSEIIRRIKKDYNALSGENIADIEKDKLTEFIKNKLECLNLELQKLKKGIAEAENSWKYIENKKKNLREKVSEYNTSDEIFNKVNEEYSSEFIEVEKVKGILNQMTLDIPENLREQKVLENTIEKTEKIQIDAAKALKTARENYMNSKTRYERLCASKDSMEKDICNLKMRLEEAEKIFKEKLKSVGFSNMDDYKSSKISSIEEGELEKTINEFYRELKSAEDRYSRLCDQIKSIVISDVDKLNEEYENIKSKRIELEENRSSVNTKLQMNKAILSRLWDLFRIINDKEKSYGVVGELAEVSKGKNAARINFERYVLSAFFDSIIEAANIRFIRMSEGRYELDRIRESGKGRAQSGLDLQVYDNYTGKCRHVKTLSGGESFKAALSLSLGLADIVQCYSGGINLDTMFVDEGFGTLDPESLDGAIKCLVDLQNRGRLVGIISHVPELKERIDAKLEIIPGPEGSRARFNIR
ncbi:MAG: SMC family ATPase [Clostridium sp.]|jgi:exonuclease SbcC|uniref:SbcC/MukB-like Walker B domain-containing protein n=1 Tax=Clostridium sp. TaxID=1506 RepID=UPI0025BB5530|nr:SMC family ATPase [Clostridium sp.]MCH3963798.1 SMC family ATPase [Clostridium sp.]MCI1714939.1 SMC family ATPase [Clostridium sp.]MCI1798872.1 SMC family ATPase [Clostridium sp.]MCI1813122.1 SMC family ATPase [Clostridium sp.]MCI1870012.1 SMC family ATPase [Clostridium sp.]